MRIVVVKDTGPAASKMTEWWVYDDHAEWKLLAIFQGPDAKENAHLFAEAKRKPP